MTETEMISVSENKKLSDEEKSVLKKMFLHSFSYYMNVNFTKMAANGFTFVMAPAIEKLYQNNEKGKREAYLRHQAYFITHAVPMGFIAGLCYALESDVAAGKIPGKTVEAIKASLMGPAAGIFDLLFFNCLRVIAGGIAIGLGSQGNILGALLFLLLYGVPEPLIRWPLLRIGYTTGTSFIDTVFESGMVSVATKAAGILGLTMVGSMAASSVSVPINWVLQIGEANLIVADLLDSIYPGILSVVIVCVMLAFVKKGTRPIWLIAGTFGVGLAGAFLGIF